MTYHVVGGEKQFRAQMELLKADGYVVTGHFTVTFLVTLAYAEFCGDAINVERLL